MNVLWKLWFSCTIRKRHCFFIRSKFDFQYYVTKEPTIIFIESQKDTSHNLLTYHMKIKYSDYGHAIKMNDRYRSKVQIAFRQLMFMVIRSNYIRSERVCSFLQLNINQSYNRKFDMEFARTFSSSN